RRCGGTENQRHIFQLGAAASHLASVIARSRVLLERRLVLFVDDDQTQMRSRCEHGTAGAHDHLHPPLCNLLPMPMPFGVRQMAVQHGDRRKAAAEAANGLRRETDLWDKNDCLPPVAHHLPDGPDVYFCLAASRDAMQQKRFVLRFAKRSEDMVEHLLLI